MSALDNALPFSPLSDVALLQITVQAARISAYFHGRGYEPSDVDRDALELQDALQIRLTGDRHEYILGTHDIEIDGGEW